MQKFRLFSSTSCGGDVRQLEQIIDTWLKASKPHIYHMAQSSLGEHLVISFIYADPVSAESSVAASAEVPAIFERTLADADLNPSEEPMVHLPEMELPY